jgi:predicted alpha/beta hydrolase
MKISGALKEVEKSAPSVINVLAYLGIGALVLGVITQLAGNGVDVSSGLGTFLNTTLGTDSVTVMTTLITVLTTVVSLIVVAVLWKFFGLGKKGKGKSM